MTTEELITLLNRALLTDFVIENDNLYNSLSDSLDELTEEKDPTPYCHGCGAMTVNACPCGPITDNN